MKYIAHAGIKVDTELSSFEKENWYSIKNVNGIEYRWRFTQDFICDVIAGPFSDKATALTCAKRMFVSMFYLLEGSQFAIINDAGCGIYEPRFFDAETDVSEDLFLSTEGYFFFDKRYKSFHLGPGVYEVESEMSEVLNNKCLEATWYLSYDNELDVSRVDEYLFTYCKEACEYLNGIILADKIISIGLQTNIYCAIIESFSKKSEKSKDFLDVIDKMYELASKAQLENDEKQALLNDLDAGRFEGARKSCYLVCEKYARKKYGIYECKRIISDAYSVRSQFSHGAKEKKHYPDSIKYLKIVVLDVLKNYFREKEGVFS